MISAVLAIGSGLLLLVGAAFALVGALGVLRLPDVYSRMHAASKAGTLGSGFCLLAVAVHETEFDVTTRALAGVAFFLLTAPLSAHLLARAALLAGYPAVASRNDFAKAEIQGGAPKKDRDEGEEQGNP